VSDEKHYCCTLFLNVKIRLNPSSVMHQGNQKLKH